ncbi:MAG: hypothetical protein ACE5I7_08735 [Candidatus Binatia bacterium]
MRWLVFMLFALGTVFIPVLAPAVSLSGIMVYSSDDFGNPSGYDWDTDRIATGVLWRTAPHPHWYGLGVLNGLPPESLADTPINAPDFTVDIPLAPGENTFTLVGEPGGGGGGDFQRFVLDLFFDGALDYPGISILMPRRDAPVTSAPIPSRADIMLTFSVQPVRNGPDGGITPEASYSDGETTVFVGAASFGWLGKFPAPDLISGGTLVPNGTGDVVGFMTIVVEETPPPAPAPAPAGVAPQEFGVVPGGGPSRADTNTTQPVPRILGAPRQNRPVPYYGPPVSSQEFPPPATPEQPDDEARVDDDGRTPSAVGTTPPTRGTATPSGIAGGTPTSRITSKASTPTPQGTSAASMLSPVTATASTPEPKKTSDSATPTPRSSARRTRSRPVGGHQATLTPQRLCSAGSNPIGASQCVVAHSYANTRCQVGR